MIHFSIYAELAQQVDLIATHIKLEENISLSK